MPVDIVDVFRAPAALPEIARDAVAIGAKCLWCQFTVINEEGARIAERRRASRSSWTAASRSSTPATPGRMHWLGFNTERITAVREGLQ